jgi:predicted MFS family arabinose efflux permease
VAGFIACWELGVGGGSILMAHVAQGAGFYVMFVVAAFLPLFALTGLPWLGDWDRSHPRGKC